MNKTLNDFFVRPTYKAYGVYKKTGMNKAKVIYEGTKDQCYLKLNEIRKDLLNA